MKSIRQVPGPRVALLAVGSLLGAAVYGAPADEFDFEGMARARVSAFFEGTLQQQDFSLTSAWRRNFNAVNIADRAPLKIATLEIAEMRLPDNPNGLEAVFSIQVQLPAAAYLDEKPLAAGEYTLAGSMNFYHTTRGYLVRDCSFTLIDRDGNVQGSNYLPWKTAVTHVKQSTR